MVVLLGVLAVEMAMRSGGGELVRSEGEIIYLPRRMADDLICGRPLRDE